MRFCLFLQNVVFLFFLGFAPLAIGDGISERMQKFVDSGEVAGAVTLVANREGVTHWEAVGKSDLASGRAMRKDDLFWIASMTKPMTAICVMILQDEGKLTIEDPVQKWLPEFSGQWLVESQDKDRRSLVRPERAIRIKDLLTHTSGLGDVKPPRANSTLGELAMGYAREPLSFQPGSKWSYSNPGINTLGRIVEVVGGKPFAEFLRDRVLDPLGMKDTTFWPAESSLERVARSYKKNKDTGKLEEVKVYFIEGSLSDRTRTAFPAGGLYSTALDVSNLYRMMFQGGALDGVRILKPETVRQMTSTQSGEIKTGFVDGMSWGLGFQVVKDPQGVTAGLSRGSFGHGGAYATQSWGDPEKGRVDILLIQRTGLTPNGDSAEIRAVFHEAAASAGR